LELWLDNPVTKTLARCFEWYKADIHDEINSGSCISRHNADLTLANIMERQGNIQALITVVQFEAVLNRYGMIEDQKDVQAN